MKKLILVTLLTVIVALTVGQAAFAETVETQICEIAKQNEKVLDAKCIVYQRACLVAIKTEKFTTKSEYEEYLKQFKDTIKSEFEIDDVFVTRNPRIMQKLNMLSSLNENKRNEIVKEIIEKELDKKFAPDKEIMPRRLTWAN